MPTKIEDTIINQTIVEYYEAYFHPFEGFSDEEREKLKDAIVLQDKITGKYDEFEKEMEDKYGKDNDPFATPDSSSLSREQRIKPKLEAVIQDNAASEGEKDAARRKLMLLSPEVIETNYLMRIEYQLDKIERQKKKLKVTELSFNTYYEYALERIPQITREQHIQFKINEFVATS